jgi:SAM-dependent methyltransferase
VKSCRRQLKNESPPVNSGGRARRSPCPIAWLLLLASAAAVLVVGLVATALVLSRLAPGPVPTDQLAFWISLLIGCGLTLASLGLRGLRWVFLLRRTETRIPIRDAYIGYFSGFSLLLAPLLLGEIAVRAYVHRQRGGVPPDTTAIVNLWERLLDAVAVAVIAAVTAIASGHRGAATIGLLAAVATICGPVRRFGLKCAEAAAGPLRRFSRAGERRQSGRLASTRTWLIALIASVAAWSLPGLAFWAIASAWHPAYSFIEAQLAYTSSTLAGGVALAPGGVVIAGGRMLEALGQAGLPAAAAAWSVLGIRLATTGLSTALGSLFLLFHVGSGPAGPAGPSHFDEIADAYDVQIPEARREALLAKKTALMREFLTAHRIGRRGLDVGCGRGWYVARMRQLGYDVTGIDTSEGQVTLAARHAGGQCVIQVGSALRIPAPDTTYDFVYSINVLHHLSSVDEQRAAFAELLRVLRPGGLLFLHEINTRNILFRFYMGYVFPSLNCIDEGVERWLLPTRLARYTDVPVMGIRYFTFLPDFVPAALVRLLAPLERSLEVATGVFSAHYGIPETDLSAPDAPPTCGPQHDTESMLA